MKIGIPLFMLRPEHMAGVAQRAEQLGFESVWMPEHLVFPVQISSRYPYTPDGVPPINPSTPLLDPLILLTQVASCTSRIRLGTNIYLAPLRHPLLVARMAMTLDLLSGGRLSFGVGAGWLREEFDAVGLDFETRTGRLRECVRAMRILWTEPEPEFHGRYFSFGPLKFEPKPVQKPHPPIIFGGETDAALRRAAALGDGWYGVGHSPESVRPQVGRLRAHLNDAGRSGEPFEVTVSTGSSTLTPEDIDRYADAGVARLVVLPWRRGREAQAHLERLAATVAPFLSASHAP
jgi:probable F420-dependent oxidoreductase